LEYLTETVCAILGTWAQKDQVDHIAIQQKFLIDKKLAEINDDYCRGRVTCLKEVMSTACLQTGNIF